MFLLKVPQSLLNLIMGVGLSLNFIPGVPDPLLGYIDLLDNLRKSSKGVIKIYLHI